ncbi:hypothetical protein GAS19_23815 [Burkholderia glumae]|nr:hypothetical protein GAS19_23815 [Burkholderia glumae]
MTCRRVYSIGRAAPPARVRPRRPRPPPRPRPPRTHRGRNALPARAGAGPAQQAACPARAGAAGPNGRVGTGGERGAPGLARMPVSSRYRFRARQP